MNNYECIKPMRVKEMTDNEIIKEFERRVLRAEHCGLVLLYAVLDLINRQRRQIDNLVKETAGGTNAKG